MIPIRDHNRHPGLSLVTLILIIANTILFLYMLSLSSSHLELFISQYALIPSNFNFLNLISSQFIHGSWAHLLGNMLFLRIFGGNIEYRLGSFRFIIFYLFCGILAGLTQYLLTPDSNIPIVGASGSIAGTMGSYLLLFPKARIDMLVPLGLLFPVVTVPAQMMILYWIGAQLLYSWGGLGLPTDNVAYTAHVGGFFAGILMVFILLPRKKGVRGQLTSSLLP